MNPPPSATAGVRRHAESNEKQTSKKSKQETPDPLANREFILVSGVADASAACKRLSKETLLAIDCEGVQLSR